MSYTIDNLIRCEEDLLAIAIGIKAEDNGSFTWDHDVDINSLDDQIIDILDDAPDFIRELLLEGEINGAIYEDLCLEIRIYVGNYDGGPLDYVVFLHGEMDENEKRKIIDSTILEEAMEVAIKDCLNNMAEERKLNSAKCQCA